VEIAIREYGEAPGWLFLNEGIWFKNPGSFWSVFVLREKGTKAGGLRGAVES